MSTLFVALAVVVAAPGPEEKPGPEPTLIGEWIPESVNLNGNPSESTADRWVFASDGTWAIHARGEVIDSGTFTWDPKRSPGTMDLAHKTGGGLVNLCRYRLDGDNLVLSLGHNPEVRPADVQPAKKTTVWVLKRAPK